MPYKDPDKQREYMRQWIAQRRLRFFADKQCAVCGSKQNLELDHIDPVTKITNSIWSWSEERRETELVKCQILCKNCHQIKSKGEHARGVQNGQAKLTEVQVTEIFVSSIPKRQLGRIYGVDERTIRSIKSKRIWKDVTQGLVV